jgi:nucleoid-associated protein YgaU
MRPAISRFARSGRMLAALLVGLSLACGGGGGGSQATVVATVPSASPVASPQRPALASPVTASSPVVPSASPPPATTSTGGGGGNEQTYEIQSGDTLLSIAEQFYGDNTQWRKIYDANRDVIGSNPDALKVGTTLKIPPKDS